jgi:DNA-binding SARP family transcriptional activator
MSEIAFRGLGPLDVSVAGRRIAVDAPRQQVILSMLLLSHGRTVPVEQLIDAVWPDDPPTTARSQVQICISALRRALGSSRILTHPSGYSLRADDDEVDLVRFDRRLAAGRSAVASGQLEEAVQNLRAALRLWRGSALAGIPGRTIEAAAARLEEQRVAVIEELVEIELALGRHRELTSELVGLVGDYPLRERLRGYLMVALYRCGRPAEALDAYRAARREFIEELGLEPGEPLRQLEQAILARDAGLDLGGTGGPGVARAGEGGEVDNDEGAAAGNDRPQQLPADIADFTGHPDLVEQLLIKIVGDPARPVPPPIPVSVPLCVITGLGGVGKTTLAVRAAHLARHAFPDGQLFASLRGSQETSTSPEEILGRFLRALGVPPTAIGTGVDERAETYRSRLAGRRVLVVLDDAGDEGQVLPLLPGSPGCAVIITSRFRLGALPGVRATEVDVLTAADAIDLLTDIVGVTRAGAEPTAVADLAALCGGLPLALRIVGARLAARPHWRLDRMVERLTNERNRLDELSYGELRVRATLSVTYEVLSPPAQRLFRLLGVVDASHFAAWTAVVLLDAGPEMAAGLIDELVDVRLLEIETNGGDVLHYRFHDLVRVFARDLLHAHEPEAEAISALVRLLGGYLTLVEEAHRRMYGGDYTVLHGAGPRWQPDERYLEELLRDPLAWFEAERPALLAAIRQAAEADLDELCWGLAVTAVTLFEARGYYDDWRATHELALAATRRAGNLRGEAATLCSLGSLGTSLRGDNDHYLLRRALHLFQRLGEHLGTALALRNLANFDQMEGRSDEAMAGYERALAGFRRVSDRVGEAHVLGNLAQIYLDRGELARAETLLHESLDVSSEVGNARVAAQTLHRLGDLMLRQGRLTEAEAAFREVLTAAKVSGDRVGQVYALTGLGLVFTGLRGFGVAEELLAEAHELCREVGGRQAQAGAACVGASEHRQAGAGPGRGVPHPGRGGLRRPAGHGVAGAHSRGAGRGPGVVRKPAGGGRRVDPGNRVGRRITRGPTAAGPADHRSSDHRPSHHGPSDDGSTALGPSAPGRCPQGRCPQGHDAQ